MRSESDLRLWMHRTDKLVYVGLNPCPSSHRLYLRTGRCAQCRPAGLAYLARMSQPGYTYVAFATKSRVVKVGCTDNVERRIRDLGREAYGGYADWTFIEKFWCDRAGYAEHLAHLTLQARKFKKLYEHNGREVASRELFECTAEEGKKAAHQGWRLARNEEIRARLDGGEFADPTKLRVLLPS